MDLVDKIREIAARIPKQLDFIQTEEATKNAFVMPFINALGYDVFNPMEVLPEFTSDVGTKKGEKVDYAIKKDSNIIMLIECKWCGCDLDKEHIAFPDLFDNIAAMLKPSFCIFFCNCINGLPP